jgi:hypothetical protein
MATIGRTSGASFLNSPRLSYIATAAFNTYFYSYSTSINARLETIGTLAAVTGANAGNCPMGRVLRENGRKLYPGANPGITTYLVGVYDSQTLLTGFIDPNAGVFQIYNTDKPTYLLDGVEPTVASTDRGPSIYTRGNVLGGGDLDISGNGLIYGDLGVVGDVDVSGNELIHGDLGVVGDVDVSGNELIHGDLGVVGDVDVSGNELIHGDLGVVGDVDISGTLVVNNTTTHRNHVTLATGDLIVSTGVFKLNESNGPAGAGSYDAGNAIVGQRGFGGSTTITITTTSCLSSSYVFLTLVTGGAAVLRVSAVTAGSFNVSNSAGGTTDTFNWLIINPA